MKKVLLASTALLGAVMISQPASAQIVVKLGGYINFTGGFFDHDYLAGTNNDFDFDNEVEVHVRADGKADNGLEYGVKIELETGGTVFNGDGRGIRTDEANIYVAGSWGRVELGDDDGASDVLNVSAPVAGAGFSDQGDRFGDPAVASDWLKVVDSSDASKISYFTPTFAGFRAGISYAPETAANAGEGDAVRLTNPITGYSNWIEAGAQYKATFGGFGVAASATASRAESNVVGRDDFFNWQLGANVSFAGFTVGGGWIDYDDAVVAVGPGAGLLSVAAPAKDGWNAGASYTMGPVSASIVYATVDFTGFDYSTWLFDVGYTVAPGLVVGASYRPYTIDPTVGPDLDGHTILLGTKMSF
jgi:hypothetical protein